MLKTNSTKAPSRIWTFVLEEIVPVSRIFKRFWHYFVPMYIVLTLLKPLYTFGTEEKIKAHRFTNNLQGLQKVMVKDFSWNIFFQWNALLFEKTVKQLSILDSENYGFILNTCHYTAKRAETRVGFSVIFSRLRWPIEPKFSQVCYFIYKLWYTKCGPLDNTVSNGFKKQNGFWWSGTRATCINCWITEPIY